MNLTNKPIKLNITLTVLNILSHRHTIPHHPSPSLSSTGKLKTLRNKPHQAINKTHHTIHNQTNHARTRTIHFSEELYNHKPPQTITQDKNPLSAQLTSPKTNRNASQLNHHPFFILWLTINIITHNTQTHNTRRVENKKPETKTKRKTQNRTERG